MMTVNWRQKNRDNMHKGSKRFYSDGYISRYYPTIRDVFIENFIGTPEKEFSETEGFARASEALRRIAKQVADYIQYELGVKGNIVLDYDSELEEVFIRIKPAFHSNSKKKIELEKNIITKISEKFQADDIWDINIMIE